MSNPNLRVLPASPSATHLKRQARELRAAFARGEHQAHARVRAISPGHPADGLKQADALLVIAREYGFASWSRLKRHVDDFASAHADAKELQDAWSTGDVATRRRIKGRAYGHAWVQNLDPNSPTVEEADAHHLLSYKRGFPTWEKYVEFLNLDPGVKEVLAAISGNDFDGLSEMLAADPAAANPHFVPGYELGADGLSGESIPLFVLPGQVFSGQIPPGTNERAMTRLLLQAGADPDINGGVPLDMAVSFNSIPVATELLRGGASVDGPHGNGGPMAHAAQFGFLEIQALLIDHGASLDMRLAAAAGQLDLVKAFVAANGSLKPNAGSLADPFTTGTFFGDPNCHAVPHTDAVTLQQSLYFACRSARLEVAAYLLRLGADIDGNVEGVCYDAPVLHHCAGFGGMIGKTVDRSERVERCLTVTEFLLDHGADPTIRVHGKDAAGHGASKPIKDLIRHRMGN